MYFPDRGVRMHPTHLVCLRHWCYYSQKLVPVEMLLQFSLSDNPP